MFIYWWGSRDLNQFALKNWEAALIIALCYIYIWRIPSMQHNVDTIKLQIMFSYIYIYIIHRHSVSSYKNSSVLLNFYQFLIFAVDYGSYTLTTAPWWLGNEMRTKELIHELNQLNISWVSGIMLISAPIHYHRVLKFSELNEYIYSFIIIFNPSFQIPDT